jgi:hypothetical protein
MPKAVRVRAASCGIVAVLAWVGLPATTQAQGLMVTGYGDLEWSLQDRGDAGWKNFFDNHHFNLIFLGAITEDLGVGAEVEYEHAGEEIALEYAYLSYHGIDYFRIVGGKFIIPFNRWNKDLHPTWISKVPGRPLPYDVVFPSTYSDVGLWFSGGVPLGNSGSRFVYDAYVVNGLEGEADTDDWRDLRDNDREGPRGGNDKGIGARVGAELRAGLGVAVSAYTGEYAEDQDPTTEEGLRMTFLGADADYHWRELSLRGELVWGKQERSFGLEDAKRWGWYAQGAYEVVQNFEPVVRYSWVDFTTDDARLAQLGIGFTYYLKVSARVRLDYFFNMEPGDTPNVDDDALVAQFVIVF